MTRSTGDQREDAAAAAGKAARAVFTAAEVAVIRVVADAVKNVARGTAPAGVARRRVVRTAVTIMMAALGHLRPVLDAAARDAGGGSLDDADRAAGKAAYTAVVSAAVMFDEVTGSLGMPAANGAAARRQAQGARLDRAQAVMNKAAASGLTGFTDAAGRNWNLDTYAAAATRGAVSQLHVANQLAAVTAQGGSMVMVIGPAGINTCPLCRPWEGKLLSVGDGPAGPESITDSAGTGRTGSASATLEEAMAAGLLHVACRHSLVPWMNGQNITQIYQAGTPGGAGAQDYGQQQDTQALQRSVRSSQRLAAAAMTASARTKAAGQLAVASDKLIASA